MKFRNKKIIIGISLMISLLCFSNTVKAVSAEKLLYVVAQREDYNNGGWVEGVEYNVYKSSDCGGIFVEQGTTPDNINNQIQTKFVDNETYSVKVTGLPVGFETVNECISGIINGDSNTAIIKVKEVAVSKKTLSFKMNIQEKGIEGKYLTGKITIYDGYSVGFGCKGNILKENITIKNSPTNVSIEIPNEITSICISYNEIQVGYKEPVDKEYNLADLEEGISDVASLSKTGNNDTDSDKDEEDNDNGSDDKTNTSATNKIFNIAFKYSSNYIKNVEFSIYDAIKNNKCTGDKIYSTKSLPGIMATTAVTSTTGKYCLHVTDATDSYLIPSDEDISNKTDITVTLAQPQIKIEFINSNKESIADVKFNIYDEFNNNTCSGNKLITNDVSSLNKPFIQHTKASSTGKYCLKVSDVPEGYVIPSDSIVKLTNDTSNVNTITLEKKSEVATISTGSIKISVVDKDKNLLENVKFKICTDKECENEKYNVTSTDEVYSVPNVPFDTYYVKIISVPDGYVLPKEPIKLELNEEKSNITKTITIDATTKVPDTLSNISKLLILCGIVGIISGTVLVYTNAKKQEQV